MNRRAFCSAVTTTGAGLLAGCAGGSDGAGGRGTVDSVDWSGTPTPSRARPALQSSFEFDAPEPDPASESSVGSRESVANPDDRLPWRVAVWNDADETRSLALDVFAESAGRVVDRSVTLGPRAYHELRLLEPDRYAVQVRAPDRPRYELQIARRQFDCNHHAAYLRVTQTGLAQYTTISTAVACGPVGTAGDDGESPAE